jgi:thiol-disulfide isomerase/thioredoxin
MAGPRTAARLTLVYAHWCPHCDPISLEQAPRLAATLGVPLRLLDIDKPEQERIADELVRAHGDWTEDYLIPQLFLEWADGQVTHLLTGIPGDPSQGTRRAWQKLSERGRGLLQDLLPR